MLFDKYPDVEMVKVPKKAMIYQSVIALQGQRRREKDRRSDALQCQNHECARNGVHLQEE